MRFIKYVIKKRVKILWYLCIMSIIYATIIYKSEGDVNLFEKIPYLDKIAHFMMFFTLAAIGGVYIVKTRATKFVYWQITNFICVVALGGLIEIIQPYFGRENSLDDFYANTLGAFVGVIVSRALYYKVIKKIFK